MNRKSKVTTPSFLMDNDRITRCANNGRCFPWTNNGRCVCYLNNGRCVYLSKQRTHPWVTMVMKCKQLHEYINNGLFAQRIVAWPLNQSDIPIWRIRGHKPDDFADDESQMSLFHLGVSFNY